MGHHNAVAAAADPRRSALLSNPHHSKRMVHELDDDLMKTNA
jgi:hypothetical protein